MACLSFGRPMLRGATPPASAAAAEAGSSVSGSLADQACSAHVLAVPEDPGRTCSDGAVFEAVAQQATAFICNLDEATVNCGAVELGCSAGGICPPCAGDATPPGSCSGSLPRSGASSASSTVRSPTEGGDGSTGRSGWAGGSAGSSALFRRLSAAKADSGECQVGRTAQLLLQAAFIEVASAQRLPTNLACCMCVLQTWPATTTACLPSHPAFPSTHHPASPTSQLLPHTCSVPTRFWLARATGCF